MKTTTKRHFKIIPNIKESDTLKLLEQRYQRLRFQTNSWTRDQLDEIKNLQNLIIEENKNLNETYWNKKIEDLQDIYNDPTKFWRQIRMLKGSSNPETPYLINEQNEKVYDTHDKLELHKKLLAKHFQNQP